MSQENKIKLSHTLTHTRTQKKKISPIDKEMTDLAGLGSTTRLSTMDLMGLWVFLAMSDASTFHRSRKTCVDISNLEISNASTPRNSPRRQIYHVSRPGWISIGGFLIEKGLEDERTIILGQTMFHHWEEDRSSPIIEMNSKPGNRLDWMPRYSTFFHN